MRRAQGRRDATRPAEVSPRSPTARAYLSYGRAKAALIASAFLLLAVLAVISVRLGATGLSYGEILRALLRPDGSWPSVVVWKLRLPRIAAAALAGASLSLSGTVMQSILRNPLASPFTLGISNAAAFGAALAIVAFGGGRMLGATQIVSLVGSPVLVAACAFSSALAAAAIIIGLARIRASSPETIALAGLAISSIFGTGLALLTFLADDVAVASIVFWQFGSLSKAEWGNTAAVAVVSALSFIYFFYKRWDYNALEAGEDVAKGLGVRIRRTRLVGLAVSALLTSTVVSFYGVIGFIGLIGPHMAKRLIGDDSRYSLSGSMAAGALVLLAAHIVGSYAFKQAIPVGIVSSAIGGPLFLAMLLRGGSK